MKALVLEAYNSLAYREVDTPEPSDDEALVRVRACGICGSDVHGLDGSSGRRKPPLIMGHEASGEIVSVGKAVTHWKTGDRVTFDSTVYRLDDWYTQQGRYNLSEGREVFGVSPGTYRRNGAFAEFVAVPQHVLHRVPDNVSFEQAAMVEPIAVALHAVNLSEVRLGQSCAIVGVGTIGVFVLQLLKIAGCGDIVAVDLSEAYRSRAERLGATVALHPDDPKLGGWFGRTDVAYEAVGAEPTVNMAIELVRRGGTVTLIGNVTPDVRMPLQKIVTHQLRLQGSCAICGEYPTVLHLLAKGSLSVDEHIAAVAPLAEGAEWFEKIRNGDVSGKVILKP